MSESRADDSLEAALERLRLGLEAEKPTLDVLLARDAIERQLQEARHTFDRDLLEKVSALDERLRTRTYPIEDGEVIAAWRTVVRAPEAHWWWYPSIEERREPWDLLDFFWKALTMALLGLCASFSVGIVQAVVADGLSWQATFMTLLQGVGLAIIGSGTLSWSEDNKVQLLLARLGVPSRFRAELLCLLAIISCLVLWRAHVSWLPDYFANQGEQAYLAGDLEDAAGYYTQALGLVDEPELRLQRGTVYESLHQLDDAVAEYRRALPSGRADAFNRLGRAYLHWTNPVTLKSPIGLAESLLRMGLQRVEQAADPDPDLHYQLHRNLGWSLVLQDRLPEARNVLERAVALDAEVPGMTLGSGMAHCFLIHVYVQEGEPELAERQRRQCVEHGRPETIDEYEWLLSVDERAVADCVDTRSIVSGMARRPACQRWPSVR